MANPWALLGKERLNDIVGEQRLSRLGQLLPAIQKVYDPLVINSNDGLAKIFNAFVGAEQMEKLTFRKEFFNCLPHATLSSLIRQVSPDHSTSSWETWVNEISIAWTDPSKARLIAAALEIPEDFLPETYYLPPLDQIIEANPSPYLSLKDYQSAVFFEALEQLRPNLARCMLQMPTGSGKTRVAIEILSHFINSSVANTQVLWLVHSEELCEQAYECFFETWAHIGLKPIRLTRCWGDSAKLPFNPQECGFVIASFPRLAALLKKNAVPFKELAKQVGLIVIDEAHRVIAPTFNAATMALLGSNTRVLGLTATPGRSSHDTAGNEALAELFFNNLVSIESGKEPVIAYLRSKGVLSRIEMIPLKTERNYQLNARDIKYLTTNFDVPSELLETLATDDLRNVEIIKRVQQECALAAQIIFFGCSVEHSKFICALLNFIGIKTAHVDGTTSKARRQALVRDYKRSRLQVLCNFNLFSTGFDAPKTNVIFISRPTASIVLYSQMLGRGTRGPAIGGTEQCKVIQVVDNITGFPGMISAYEHFEDYYSSQIE